MLGQSGLLLALLAMLGAQSQPAVTIRGRILDDIRHQPLDRVVITLIGAPGRSVSDEQGLFTLTLPRSGNYTIQVQKGGFLGLQESFELTNAGADLGDVVLTAARSISGTLRWRGGDSEGLRIQALQVKNGKIFAEPEGGNSTFTQANGEFQLGALRPGHYVVMAQTFKPGNDRVTAMRPVFFPGTYTPDVNRAIDLTRTTQYTSLSIDVKTEPGVSVSGTVLPSAGSPAVTSLGLILMVANLDTVLPTFAAAVSMTTTVEGGRFQFSNIPPAAYNLWVVGGNIGSDNVVVRRVPLRIASQPIANLRVMAPEPSAPILGTAEIQEANASVTRVSRLFGTVKLQGNLSRFPVTNEDGDLKVPAMILGESVNLQSLEAPRGTYVASVFQGNRDLSRGPYTLAPNGDRVRILLKKDGGTIDGKAVDRNAPGRQAFVVLAPKDRAAESRYRTATATLLDGSFRFENVAPGDYNLFAFDRNEEDQYLQPAYLGKFAQQSVAVSLQPRSSRSAQVQTIKTR